VIDRIVVWVLTLPYRVREERGQDLVEYALITGGVGLMVIAATVVFREAVITWWGNAATAFTSIAP
jgi:Flp pilus assembly pilin Flp